MLFHDPSCRAEITLKENFALGMYEICHLDWVSICTKTDGGALYVDAQINVTGIDRDLPVRFLNQFGSQLTHEQELQAFQMEGCYFWKMSIRRDEHYSVFSLYCRRGEPISGDNLAWLQICSQLKYEYTLLNNEAIQERDLTEHIVDSIEAAIVVMDLTQHVITCNGKIKRVLGLEAGSLPGRNFLCYIDPEWKELFAARFRRVTEEGRKQNINNSALFQRSTDHIVNVTLSPLRDSKGRIAGAVLVGSDVTELRYMEHELQQTKQFGLLGQIAAGLAHDVKNPLMNINGCARALLRNTDLDPEHMELLNIILHESARINDVMEQMLSFGNISAKRKYAALDLNALLTNCVRIINRQKNGKRIEVGVDLDRNLPTLIGDSGGIQQALLNILVNSVEAIRSDGFLQVTSRRLEDGDIEIRVRDNGHGVSDQDLKKLFTPYFSTKEDGGGSGLGLFLAKRILDQHGATIRVTSERNVGTEVVIVFPSPERTNQGGDSP